MILMLLFFSIIIVGVPILSPVSFHLICRHMRQFAQGNTARKKAELGFKFQRQGSPHEFCMLSP